MILAAQIKTPVLSGKEKLSMYQSHEKMRDQSQFNVFALAVYRAHKYQRPLHRCGGSGAQGPELYHLGCHRIRGVWKSINEGVTFEPVFEHQGTSTIGDLAISPSNPDMVWAGTGEANIFRSSNPGCGVWKTEDGGESWTHMGLEETFTISRILVHPTNPEVVYVAASGHEWTQNKERGLL